MLTTHTSPAAGDARPERDHAAAARDRADRTAGGLSDLLSRRPDLRGVHAPADWLDDSTRWSV